eukprot:TRINITY_DN1990_c0_g1_i1.p1 TRINITY_DN1990_c0_g1~~TRINITY_DN1990_c0_g1_i1.p1  ORF type:complete len:112 (-),score=39.43 TRINITY_DN1990_c0_g1_i1:21-323(-)
MFGREEVIEEYAFRVPWGTVVFDFYVPKLKLMVEYQGEQHYYSVLRWVSVEEQRRKDQVKVEICEENGFGLVLVPYWWDNTLQSLYHIIFPQQYKNNLSS